MPAFLDGSAGAPSPVPMFAFGHPFVTQRVMAFAAEDGDASLCIKFGGRVGMADPFGMPGSEFLAFALARSALSPEGHTGGQAQLATMCTQLKALMDMWQNARQDSSSWVVAALLCQP